MTEFVSPAARAHFQYADPEHQAHSAISGMWLFLATEVLFFGALFYLWLLLRFWHPDAFAAAAHDTDLLIGSVNTTLLTASSFVYLWSFLAATRGRARAAVLGLAATGLIGAVFVGLKLFEWSEDVAKGKVPGAGFVATGPDPGGQHLFWLLYYAGTGLHVVHMVVGLGLVAWIARRIHRGTAGPQSTTSIEAVGLYWSFVDIVWLNLYPFIYVLDRS